MTHVRASTLSPFAAALAGCLVLTAAMGIGRFAYTPMLPAMREAFGWSVAQAGDVGSANFMGYVVGALVATRLAQRHDRTRWLFAALALTALTTGAGAFTTGWIPWLALRFASGIASALCLVIASAVVMANLASRGRAELGALHFGGVGAGIVISVATIETARAASLAVGNRWGCLGVVAAALGAAAWPSLRRMSDVPVTATLAPARHGRPPLARMARLLVVSYGLFGFGYVVTATFIVAMARDLDRGIWLEPVTWAVVGMLAAPSVFAWQAIVRRLGMITTLRVAYSLEAAGVLIAGCASTPAFVVLGGAMLGATFMGITALGLGAAREAAGQNGDRIIGWMSASFGIGQLLGPAVAGRMASATGSFAAPSVVAALLLVVGLGLLRDR